MTEAQTKITDTKVIITNNNSEDELFCFPASSFASFLNSELLYSKDNSESNLDFAQKDLYKDLGVRTFINCAGTYTALTGSLMPKEVTDAITFGTSQYVELDELQDRVGERISELLKCEYATVSSGCFGAMSIATAGVMCGMDNNKVIQLPNTDGMKNEVILQESHYMGYCQALTNVGAKLVKIKSTKEFTAAFYESRYNKANKPNSIGFSDKRRNVE